MGHLTVGNHSVVFEDRVIEHLEAAFSAKLRRHEPFLFFWSIHQSLGSGRMAVWVHPAIGLDYRYDSLRRHGLNPVWVDALVSAASSPSGMRVVPEPTPQAA